MGNTDLKTVVHLYERCGTEGEREGLRTGFDGSLEVLRRVQLRPPVVAPIGEARSDTDIVLALAERLGLSGQFFGGSADAGHDHALSPAGLSVAQLLAVPEGVVVYGAATLEAHAVADGNGGCCHVNSSS